MMMAGYQKKKTLPTSSAMSSSPSPHRHQRSHSQTESPDIGSLPFDSLIPEDNNSVRLPIFNKLFANGSTN